MSEGSKPKSDIVHIDMSIMNFGESNKNGRMFNPFKLKEEFNMKSNEKNKPESNSYSNNRDDCKKNCNRCGGNGQHNSCCGEEEEMLTNKRREFEELFSSILGNNVKVVDCHDKEEMNNFFDNLFHMTIGDEEDDNQCEDGFDSDDMLQHIAENIESVKMEIGMLSRKIDGMNTGSFPMVGLEECINYEKPNKLTKKMKRKMRKYVQRYMSVLMVDILGLESPADAAIIKEIVHERKILLNASSQKDPESALKDKEDKERNKK